jgi:hypothetical protein
MAMKAGKWMAGRWSREFWIGSTLLLLYAVVLAGSDPEWATWAGAMAAGVLVIEPPPPMPFSPSGLFADAGTLAALGVIAFAALPMFAGGERARPAGGSAGAQPPVRPFTETGGANR